MNSQLVRAYRQMDMKPKELIIRIVAPVLLLCILLTGALIYVKLAVPALVIPTYVIVPVPLFGLGFIAIYPVLRWEKRRKDIDSNIHLFITRMGVMSCSNLPRKKLFKSLAEVKEYGELSTEIGKIYSLMEYWNYPLP